MFYTLPAKIEEYIDEFTGRAWLLPRVLKWYENAYDRMLLLTGDPGTGKSMVAAWLAGSGPLPQDPPPGTALPDSLQFDGLLPSQQLERLRSQVQAVHFCQADGGSVQPGEMARNLADQLTGRVSGFDQEVKAILADRIVLAPTVTTGTVETGGRVTGLSIGTINLKNLDDQARFNRSVRDPLNSLYKHSAPGPMLLIIDSLDEALTYSGGTKIPDLLATLSDLPYQVRFLATTRPDPRVLKLFFDVPTLDLVDDAPPDAEDVRRYAHARLHPLDEPQRSELAQQVGQASKGIFLYGRLVVEDLLEDLKQGSLSADLTLPPGLSGYYNQFLGREVGKDIDRWRTYQPVLGVVAVAQGDGLQTGQVGKVTQQDAEKILLACLQYMDGAYPEGPFRVFHRSLAEFLLEDREYNKYYRIDAPSMHALIADYYYSLRNGTPPLGKWDEYALRHMPVHLEGASGLEDEEARHEQAKRLVQLMQDPMFQKRFRKKINDEFQMKHIILSAVRAAAADTREDALELLLSAVRHSQTHRHEWLRPAPLFEMAEKGNPEAALKQLAAFPLEAQWQGAASLVLAWSAAKKAPGKARQELQRIESQADRSALEIQLGQRLAAVLDGVALPLGFLPAPPPRDLLDQLLLRLGGQEVAGEPIGNITSGFDLHPSPEILELLGELAQPGGGDEVPVFLAQQDGPFLVAYAVPEEDRQEGLHVFQKYLELHAENPYLYYRNASLWLLIDSVLRHPDDDWALQALKSLFLAALDVEGRAYEECLALALLALQGRAGQVEGRQALDARREDALEQALKLGDARYTSDIWGTHKRRLSALAQAYSLLPDGEAVAAELLAKARDLPRGYAGFMCSSWLNLAEAIRVCGLEDSLSIDGILKEAMAAAQNIQDSVFCARSTARVNAMMRRWWPMPEEPDLEEMVRKFGLQPGAAEFTALHIIGEDFPKRERGPDKLPLHQALLHGTSLGILSEAFRLPLADFLAVNAGRGWDASTALPNGTEVNVPDPEFAPLVAARLAVEVAAADWLFPNEKRALIQPLAVAAIHDRTALDTVLARLLLAAVPDDPALLERLLSLARQAYSQFPDSPSALGQVNTYVEQTIDIVSGSVVGLGIGPLGSGTAEVKVEIEKVEGGEVTGLSLDDLETKN